MARFVIFTQRFYPEDTVMNHVAEELVARNHEVTVMTGLPNAPAGRLFEGYGYLRRLSENWRGIDIRRNWLVPRGDGSPIRLAINYASFAISATSMLTRLRGKEPNVIFVNQATPITQAIPAVVYKAITGAPLVMWIHDLWPESLQSSGAVDNAWALAQVGRLVDFIYSRCDLIFVQSEAMRPMVEARAVYPNQIEYLPNLLDMQFEASTKDIQESFDLDLPTDAFVVMFAGALGRSHALDTVIEAARQIHGQGYTKVHWVFAGDGSNRRKAEELVERFGLQGQVHFLGYLPVELMPSLYATADVMLATLSNEPIFHLTVPLKIHSYLASGTPIICGVGGEATRIVADAGAGFTFEPEDVEGLVACIRNALALGPEQLQEIGMRGQEYFEANYTRDRVMEKMIKRINQLEGVFLPT